MKYANQYCLRISKYKTCTKPNQLARLQEGESYSFRCVMQHKHHAKMQGVTRKNCMYMTHFGKILSNHIYSVIGLESAT